MNVSAWLIDTVVIADPIGVTEAGDTVFGPQREVRARVVESVATIISADGTSKNSNQQVFLAEPVKLDAHIWLPGSDPANPTHAKTPMGIDSGRNKRGGQPLYRVML